MRVNHPVASGVPARQRVIAGVGRVLVWSGGSLWIGRAAGGGAVHAHHAIQMSIALTGRFKLRSDGADWCEYQGAIVHPHHRHQFDGCGESVAQLFVEPETALGRALLQAHSAGAIDHLPTAAIGPVIEELRDLYTGQVADELLMAAARKAVVTLAGDVPRPTEVDARVARVIDWLQTRRGAQVTLAEAAGIAHLSPSRFRHLFMAQTGVSFRAYMLWLRLASAVGAAMGGRSWTDAAQEWGFADSAHLSRTCRRMFGIAPTMLIREGDHAPRR